MYCREVGASTSSNIGGNRRLIAAQPNSPEDQGENRGLDRAGSLILIAAFGPPVAYHSVKDTVHIFRTLRNTARVFKNKVSQEVVRLERRPEGAKFEELKDLVSGARGRVSLSLPHLALPQHESRLLKLWVTCLQVVYEIGDPDYGIWSAGIVVGLIKDIPTCEELLKRIEREAESTIERLGKLGGTKAKL